MPGVGQAGIFPWSRPMPHNHSVIGQGGQLSYINALNNKPFIDAREYGASPDASAAVNDAAIAASIADLDNYGTWKLPGGFYNVSSLITFTGRRWCNIIFEGCLRITNSSGILFDDVRNSRIDLPLLFLTERDWVSDFYGVKFKHFKANNTFLRVVQNFKYAYFFDGDTDGVAYNNFYFEEALDNKYGFYYTSVNGGHVAENNYYGGRVGLNVATKAGTAGSYGAYFSGSPPSHLYTNHRYYGTCFESLHNGIGIASAEGIYLSMPRFEDVDANWFQVLDGFGVTHVVWILGVTDFDNTKVVFNAASKGILILGSREDDSGYRTIITDKENGGVTYITPLNLVKQPSNILWTPPTELTIAGGVITIIDKYHTVDGEGDAADDLDTINGGVDGMELTLTLENVGRPITVRDAVGNIELEGAVNHAMTGLREKLYLFYDATQAKWVEKSRFNG